MLAEERQSRIMDFLQKKGVVRTAQLAKELKVSTETIRKDLDLLASRSQIKKVHGGALPLDKESPTPPSERQYQAYEERSQKNTALKQRIAEAAASYISENARIALDDGTSGYAMVDILSQKFNALTVVTNSLKSAAALAANRDFTVIVSGGILCADNYACVSDFATLILEKLTVDILFLTVSGITENSLTDQRLDEIRIQQQMIASAHKVIVLADSTKFGENSFVHVCNPEDVDMIITDCPPHPVLTKALEDKGCQIVIAKEKEDDYF